MHLTLLLFQFKSSEFLIVEIFQDFYL